MVTVSHLVGKIIKDKPFLEEALRRGIINYVALAQELQPQIEKELGKKVKTSAVMMALRRLNELLQKKGILRNELKFKSEDISIRSSLFEITILKSSNTISNIRKIYDITDFSRGDMLTITHGIYEITIIASSRLTKKIEKILENEHIIKIIGSLGALTIKIPANSIETVGLFYNVTKILNWENINIVEIVSTFTEMTFILKEDDLARAFEAMRRN
ncbi:MAG: hypothetical protein KatS3mg002_0172 [Candidatus Woesearchaeota archaeon]|nr:MAG: hypothetical protein KatS3mg002_0172 [Candidatus Woesearchaeota archaeon]